MSGTNETRVVNERTGGMKGSKAEDYSLLPWEQLAEVSRLYSFGAEKYDRSNWQKGYDWHLSFASLMRHAAAWWEGEFDDEESGCDHMTSVVFHALALMYFRRYHPDLDDRPCTVLGLGNRVPISKAAPDATSDPQGGAVAVFKHISGPLVNDDPTYKVRTGMEAPSGYRFSHVEDGQETHHGSAEVTIGRQVVPRPCPRCGQSPDCICGYI